MIELLWFTNPQSPAYSEILKCLIKLLKSLNAEIISTNLGAGIFRYQAIFNSKTLLEENPLGRSIFEYMDFIAFEPLTLSYKKKEYESEYTNSSLQSIIKAVLTKILYMPVSMVQPTPFVIDCDAVMTIFSPYVKNYPIFLSSDEILSIRSKCNPDDFSGYDLLTEDPLGPYVLDLFLRESPSLIDVHKFKTHQSILLIGLLNDDSQKEFIKDFNYRLSSCKLQGYFNVSLSLLSDQDNLLIEELAELWDTSIICKKEDAIVLKLNNNDIHFPMEPARWFHFALTLIKQENLPILYAQGEWLSLFPTLANIVKLQYAAIITMVNLSLINPILSPYISKISVLDNLNIVGYFSKKSDLTTFISKMTLLIESIGSWSFMAISEDKSMDKMIVLREKLLKTYKQCHPLFITLSKNINSNSKFLVIDTVQMVDLQDLYDKITDDEVTELREKLRSYYNKVCVDKGDILTFEKISEMDIQSLSQIITDDTNDNRKYCFTHETFNAIQSIYNPVTLKPFSSRTLLNAKLDEYSGSGIYTIGPLKGILDVLPQVGLYLLDGNVKTSKVPNTDLYNVEVILKDGDILPLFYIWTSDYDTVQTEASRLWRNGFFLTPWAKAYQLFAKKQSYLVPIRNKVLSDASQSAEKGKKALEYLKNIQFKE